MQSIRNERQACIKPQNLIGDRSFSIAGGGGGVGWEDFDYVTVKFTWSHQKDIVSSPSLVVSCKFSRVPLFVLCW